MNSAMRSRMRSLRFQLGWACDLVELSRAPFRARPMRATVMSFYQTE